MNFIHHQFRGDFGKLAAMQCDANYIYIYIYISIHIAQRRCIADNIKYQHQGIIIEPFDSTVKELPSKIFSVSVSLTGLITVIIAYRSSP